MKVNERFPWAASIISPEPGDKILEIGCGAGILLEQIALKLDPGTVTAVDISESMIRLAEKRNKKYIDAGKVKMITADFAKAKFTEHHFDKIVAFNVNFFWKNPGKELQLISKTLKPGGKLYIFYQTPSGADPKLAGQIKMQLEQYNYKILDTIFKQAPESSFCIISQPLNQAALHRSSSSS